VPSDGIQNSRERAKTSLHLVDIDEDDEDYVDDEPGKELN